MNKVLGMGNALVDVLAKIEDDNILQELNLVKGGMTLIDENTFRSFLPILDRLNTIAVAGGSASNTIVGLSRLGVNTGFIGQIGRDTYGGTFKKALFNNKVTPHLNEINMHSGVATTFVSADGQRTFGTYLGAGALLNAEALDEGIFKGYNIFYIEGYLVQNHELISKAINVAKSLGMSVAIDMASYNVVEENIDFLNNLLSNGLDYVFANEDEAFTLTGLHAEEAVDVLADNVKVAVVKEGSKGSWIKRGNEKIHIPAHAEIKSLDSTGAGDLYAAGFLYGLINQFSLKECGRVGTFLAEEVIQVMGPKIPDVRWDIILKELSK